MPCTHITQPPSIFPFEGGTMPFSPNLTLGNSSTKNAFFGKVSATTIMDGRITNRKCITFVFCEFNILYLIQILCVWWYFKGIL